MTHRSAAQMRLAAQSGSTIVIGGGSLAARVIFRGGGGRNQASQEFASQQLRPEIDNPTQASTKNPFAPSGVTAGQTALNGGTIELLANAGITLTQSARVVVVS
jgi:hypothetical protein